MLSRHTVKYMVHFVRFSLKMAAGRNEVYVVCETEPNSYTVKPKQLAKSCLKALYT